MARGRKPRAKKQVVKQPLKVDKLAGSIIRSKRQGAVEIEEALVK